MKVVHISTLDSGGAAVAAHRVHRGVLAAGIDSRMLVLSKSLDDDTVEPLLPSVNGRLWYQRLFERWIKLTAGHQQHHGNIDLFSDIENGVGLGKSEALKKADIIHLHWVAGVLDYSDLPVACQGKPVVWTLHDMNAFTGGCHYAGRCNRYMEACGACPQLGSVDDKDLSRHAFLTKADAYASLDLTIVTPSQWLGRCVRQSQLFSKLPLRIIPYGLPLDVYKPHPVTNVRNVLDIPHEAPIVLFGADAVNNPRKGLPYLIRALQQLASSGKAPEQLTLLLFGHNPGAIGEGLPFRVVPTGIVKSPDLLAQLYSAADAFVIPSLEDNLPNTAIEALACGTPVVGFDAGGIRDIVDHGQTGYLAPTGNAEKLAEGIGWILSEKKDRKNFRDLCRKRAVERFSFETQANAYHKLYSDCLADSRNGQPGYQLGAIPSEITKRPDDYTWSKPSHLASFQAKKYDLALFGKPINAQYCDLKVYQDLLIFSLIKETLSPGAKILEIGGGDSRVLKYFRRIHECWNVDPLEGEGNGPRTIKDHNGYRLIRDHMGQFNTSLPDHYFDLVFSISALEHVPQDDEQLFHNIKNDIDRVLKPGGYSLHCFDVVIKKGEVWTNPFLPFLFNEISTSNAFVPMNELADQSDVYVMSESAYERWWQPLTGQPYSEFGKPLSYNILWQKPADTADAVTESVVALSGTVIEEEKTDSSLGTYHLLTIGKGIRTMMAGMEYPRISVVTPSFNQGQYLEACINSILGQGYPNLDYIIMDGGSTDGSVDIIRRYEKYLTYWQSRPDSGQYWAINEGFKKARGDIMCWLNSDDMYHPNALFYAAYIFKCLPHVHWIMGRPTVWDASGRIASVVDPLPRWTRKQYLARQYGPPHIQQESTFWRRSLWERAGGYIDTSFKLAGDLELWSRFFRFEDLYSVDLKLGGFRSHQDQKTANMMAQYREEAEKVIDREIELFSRAKSPLRPAPLPIQVIDGNDEQIEQLLIKGEHLYSAGDITTAIQCFNEAAEMAPEKSEAFNHLGVAYWRMGRQKEALENIKKALMNDPNDRLPVLNAGQIFKEMQRPDIARDLYLSYLCRGSVDQEVEAAWGQLADSQEDKEIVESIKARQQDYLVSAIVSTYNSEDFIAECIENLEAQTIADKIEIVIVDAASPQRERDIVRTFLNRFSNITYLRTRRRIGVYAAWNIAIKNASGKFCISASTNDQLRVDACELLAGALMQHPDVALVYGDTYLTQIPHETFEKNSHSSTYHWPAYSYELLTRTCMVGPHPMWRRSVHDAVGYFDERYMADGDQEFWLRIGEQYDLLHIPEFTGLQWITTDALSKKGKTPELEILQIHKKYQNRMARGALAETPLCSIIIPVFNKLGFTKQCLAAVRENTRYGSYEIIVVDNGSSDGTPEYLDSLAGEVVVVKNSTNLGFAKACNQGARKSQGAFLVFLNNDTKALPGWLDALVQCAQADEGVGIVGAKLLYPDDTIQHAGVEIADSPYPIHPVHAHHKQRRDATEVNVQKEYQAVTAACMLMRKTTFAQLGGFDEGFVNGYEDVDLCFRVRQMGKTVTYCPSSELYHYESRSEGRFDAAGQNIKRLHDKWYGKISPDSGTATSKNLNELTSIIVLACNQLAYTKKCIHSVLKHTHPPFELILVDNASTDGTAGYMMEVQKSCERPGVRVKVIANGKNVGFAAGNNSGLAQATGEYIVLLNNDVVVTSGWLDKLIARMKSVPMAGMVGPMTNHVPGEQKVMQITYDPVTLDRLERFSDAFSKAHYRQTKRVLRVVGFCVLIKRAVIEKIGGLDERYGLGNFEDDDFSLRAALAGFQSWMAGDCFVHHFGSQTFKGEGIDYNAMLRKNWDLFKRKWQMPPDLPYGAYNMSHLGRSTFDPKRDYVPIQGKPKEKDSGTEAAA